MRIIITISFLLLASVAVAQPPSKIPVIPSLLPTDEFYTRSRGRLYKVPADTLLAYIERSGDFGGVTDGDKGDITVSSSGTVWDIDADAVTATEISTGAVGSSELASTAVVAGSYTYPAFTVDADGRLTSASSGLPPPSGSGTTNRVAYWTSSTALGSFPLNNDGSTTSFTQSTQVQLPDGSTANRGLSADGDIRYNTTTEKFEGYEDGSWVNLATYIEEDFVIDFPSTSANASSDSSFAMLGANVGDAVVVVPPSGAMGQGVYFAYVNLSNNITLRFHNDGAGTYNPASGTFTIIVLK